MNNLNDSPKVNEIKPEKLTTKSHGTAIMTTLKEVLLFVLNVALLAGAILELESWYSFKSINDGGWHGGARILKERTMVDMYANDIFTHGRRTLITPFDPLRCNINFKTKWVLYWTEVTCPASDGQGQLTYTARYLNTKSVTYYFKCIWMGVDERVLERSKVR